MLSGFCSAATCMAATSRTSLMAKPMRARAGVDPSSSPVTSPSEMDVSLSVAGPRMAPGWIVVSAMS
ncbi:hypothetical protein D3C87_2017760 [compost metagenome]